MKWLSCLVLFVMVVFSISVKAQNSWFASTEGQSYNKGSIDSPWDFKTAFRNSSIQPGDTLFFRGGIYEGCNIEITLNGTSASPITVKPYKFEKVIIKGNCSSSAGTATLRLNGNYLVVRDLVVTQSLRSRISNEQASAPTDIYAELGVVVRDKGCKLINCIIYNTVSTAISAPTSAIEAEIYGNIAFNTGWMEISNSDSRYFGHGHALYFQNNEGRKLVENNIFFKQYGYGIQFYSAVGSATTGSDIFKNCIFMSGTLSSENGIHGKYNYLVESEYSAVLEDNYSYHLDMGTNYSLGYNSISEDATFNRNYSLGGSKGFYYINIKHVTARDNVVVMGANSNIYDNLMAAIYYPNDQGDGPYHHDIDRTTYYTDRAVFGPLTGANEAKRLDTWQSTFNVDANGKAYYDLGDLTTVPNRGEVIPNNYEDKRAHIVIHNHQLLPTVSVNVGSVLKMDDEYWLYDVEDLRQPIQHGIIGNDITLHIPTNQTTVFPLIGTELYGKPVHSGNNFGTFLLLGRPLDILENLCSISISSIEPEVVYEQLVVNFSVSRECSESVRAVLYDQGQNEIAQLENVSTGFTMNLPELCPSCIGGSYTIHLESSGAHTSKTFTYEPLMINSCSPDPTTGNYEVNYYSSVKAGVLLNVNGINGEKVIRDSLVNANVGGNAISIDISDSPAGEYITRLQLGTRITADTITKIDPPKELEVIRCEPDQTFTDFKVTYISPRSEAVTLRIFNSANTEVYVGNLSSVMGEQSEQVVDLGGYVSGTYRTVLDDGFTTQTCSVTKLRPVEIISYTPHETVGDVQVLFHSSVTENIKVEVFDSSEGLVFTDLVAAVVGANNQVTIDLSTQTPGSYSIVLTALSNGQSDLCEVIRQQDPRTLEIISCLPGTTVGPYDVTFYSPVAENITVDVIDESETIVMSKSVAAIVGEKNIVALDISSQLPGVYSTRLTNQANTQSDVCKVTRDEDARALEIISCSPSSTTGSYVVVFYSPVLENILAEVISVSGAIVLTKSVAANTGENNQVELDLASQLPGTYVTRLTVLSTKQTANCEVVRAEDARVLEIASCSPSSTTGSYSVTFYSPVVENIKAEVINSLGTLVLTESVSATIGENNQIMFDLSGQSPGTYTTQLTISSNGQTANCEVVRAEDPRFLEIASCSPSPTFGEVSIQFYSPQTKTVTIQVINNSGVIVLSDNHAALSGDNQVGINLSALDAGTYTIKVDDGTTSDECSVIKQDQVSTRSLEIINYTQETTSNVTIDYYCPSSATVQVEVFDSSGNRMMQMSQASTLGNNTLTFDISSLDSGQYGIRLFDGVSSKSCTVIREEDLKPFSLISSKPDITSGLYEVKFHLPVRQSVSIELKDRTGKVVYKERMAGKVGNNVFKLELSSLNDGEYLVILSDGHVFLERVVTVQGNDME